MPKEFVAELDLDAAIKTTISARGEFFPSRLEAHAAAESEDAVKRHLSSKLISGSALGPAEVVNVPRQTIGTRPAFNTRFADRAILAALALELHRTLEPLLDEFAIRLSLDPPPEGTRRTFEETPLQDEGTSRVLIADVSAFYEYVDHQLLAREIVELSGDLDLASSVERSLGELLGRGFGLPQGPRASDALADFYLSIVDRRLLRTGTTAFRFHDEFRIPVDSRDSPERLLTLLEHHLRAIGLVVNPAKTRVVTIEKYREAFERLEERLDGAREAAASQLDFYGFDPDAFAGADWGDLPVAQIEEAFEDSLGDEADSVSERLIFQFLPLLGAAESTLPLQYLDRLVRSSPWLIRSVSLYLRSLAGTNSESQMVEQLTQVLRSRRYMFPWVRGWLIDPLAHCVEPLPDTAIRRLEHTLGNASDPWFVRARALLALATEEKLPSQDAVATFFDLASPAARADIVAAVAIASPDWTRSFVRTIPKDPVLRSVAKLIGDVEDYRTVV